MTGEKTFLITGGTGFLGSALTKHLLSTGSKVRTLSRNEHSVEKLVKDCGSESALSCLLGSVEDLPRLKKALRGVTHVVHAAAQKIVPLAEYDPASCVKTNVQGTANVADACLEAGVETAVLISTDKASAPATLYGATKLCAERLWLGSNRYSAGNGTRYLGVRYGNVWGSAGSVLHAWGAAHAQGNPISLTDPRCTRFHLTLEEACSFVLSALEHASAGDLLIPKLPTYRMGDLAHAFRLAYGMEAQPSIVGLRLAEKLHEDLISQHESVACKEQDETRYVLTPGTVRERGGWGYSSGQVGRQFGVEELTRMVELWKGRG